MPVATPEARLTNKTETQPAPAVPSALASAPLKEPQHVPATTPTSRIDPPHRTPWLTTLAIAIALLALLAVFAFMGKRWRTILLATRSVLRNLKGGLRPQTRATPATMTDHMATKRARIASALTTGVSLSGPGAEDAARHMAMEILSRWQAVPAELVLSRPDAWQLFGMDIGTLQEDRIPGLVLTDDHEQTRAVLARQTSSRRVLLTCGDEGEDLSGGQTQIPVISISTRTEGPTRVSADGAVTNITAPSPIQRLPLLNRDDAFNLLMSMPTHARRREEVNGTERHAPYDL